MKYKCIFTTETTIVNIVIGKQKYKNPIYKHCKELDVIYNLADRLKEFQNCTLEIITNSNLKLIADSNICYIGKDNTMCGTFFTTEFLTNYAVKYKYNLSFYEINEVRII